jgi:selenium-binding protein 1
MTSKLAAFTLTIALAALLISTSSAMAEGFVHGIILDVDGEDYYLMGPADGPNEETDIPGHHWVQAGLNQLQGKHYNTGPFGEPQWWSSDADDGELLYMVHGIIDTWSEEKAEQYASKGYVHYHMLVAVSDSTPHADKVVWLKHTARTRFTLDGGPHPELSHGVTPGIDYEFIPHHSMPYPHNHHMPMMGRGMMGSNWNADWHMPMMDGIGNWSDHGWYGTTEHWHGTSTRSIDRQQNTAAPQVSPKKVLKLITWGKIKALR